MKDKISIIIPIYNSASYLEECLRSIEMQTYQSLEIILVYTPSKDESYRICREHIKRDIRYKMIINEDSILGAAYARNLGLEQVTGKYLGFVDSDDVIATDMFEMLLLYMQKHEADIAICQETRKKAELQNHANVELVFSGKEAQKNLLIGKYYYGELWNKLYKWELIKNIRFKELKVAEDLCFVWQALVQTQKVVYIPAPKYFYRCNLLGLTHQYSEVHYENTMYVFHFIMETLDMQDAELINALEYRKQIFQVQSFINAKLSKDKNLEKEIRKCQKKDKRLLETRSEFKKSERFLTGLYQLQPDIAYFFYRIYKVFRYRES